MNLLNLRPGDKVVYAKEHRGGYGYVTHHPALVEGVTEKRVRIRLDLVAGGTRVVSVRPENLSWPSK